MNITIGSKIKISKTLFKIIVVNGLNALIVLSLIYLAPQVERVASEVKTKSSESLARQQVSSSAVLQSEIDRNKDNIEKIRSKLSGEKTVIAFLADLDKLRSEGVVSASDFPTTQEIIDKQKLTGFPVSLSFKGDLNTINNNWQKVNSLPYLLRPVTIDLLLEDGQNTLTLGYFFIFK